MINTNNASALSYSSSVGVGFTFNPTLSVSISPSDLVISNLVPGNTLDSNVINVSIASNASYGYTLSAIVNGNNSNLTHTSNSVNNNNNNNNIFSSIATNADLSSLDNSEYTNIWGYSYKDNTVVSPAWSNYNGLSSSNNVTLLDTNANNTETGIDSIDFKIGAKAASTQASGTYTGTINFAAISNVAPMSLLDSFIASGAEQLNGYFKMQDMTHDICSNVDIEESELQLIDVRDNKIYWVAKLKDGNCWMTQNLDLNLSHDRPLTSEDTDLNDNSLSGAYSENYKYNPAAKIITWTPFNTTRDYVNNTGTAWSNNNDTAYSLNPGEWYWDKNDSSQTCNYLTTQCDAFSKVPFSTTGTHGHVGNYYNWPAAIASDDSSSLTSSTYSDANNNPQNSICPKGWKLPLISSDNEFSKLNMLYNSNNINSDLGLIAAPLFFAKAGFVMNRSIYTSNNEAYYQSSTVDNGILAFFLAFSEDTVRTTGDSFSKNRYFGRSIRCLAR